MCIGPEFCLWTTDKSTQNKNGVLMLISNVKRRLPRSKNNKRAARSPRFLTTSSMNHQHQIWSISAMLPISLIPRKLRMFLLFFPALSVHSKDNQQGSKRQKKLPKGLALMLLLRNKRTGSYLRSVILICHTQSSQKRQRRRKKHHLLRQCSPTSKTLNTKELNQLKTTKP